VNGLLALAVHLTMAIPGRLKRYRNEKLLPYRHMLPTKENKTEIESINAVAAKQSPRMPLSFAGLIELCLLAALCTAWPILGYAQSNLAILSLDELLEEEVVSASKISGKAINTPAAIHIISQEDIRRSGVNSVPDALRAVPGVHVYQIDANKWAISSRGFASRFANKMLVMIDGRTVYSPLFSGVYWDAQDIRLEDVERIEVIRGPGGALWGANAVNGVINILTKDAADTQGPSASVELDNRDTAILSAGYGGWLSGRTAYRVYGKFTDRAGLPAVFADGSFDEAHQTRIGFRTDSTIHAHDKLTFQGEFYDGKSGQSVEYLAPDSAVSHIESRDAPVSGGNLLARWTRILSSESEMSLQVYLDQTEREELLINDKLKTADIDFQYGFTTDYGLHILWGAGYRYTRDETVARETLPDVFSYNFYPRIREDDLYSGFVQGRMPFAEGRGELTIGTKVEHNDVTHFEWQPSLRAIWHFNDAHSVWAAISRSVRSPSRIELDANLNLGLIRLPPQLLGLRTFVRFSPGESLESEVERSYELGYRVRPTDAFYFDAAAFYNYYDDLINGIPDGDVFLEETGDSRFLVLPITAGNGMNGETYGLELSANWSVKEWWRLTGGFSWLEYNALDMGASREARQGFSEGQNARHLFSLVSFMDLPNDFELNASVYYADSLPELGAGNDVGVGSKVRFDFSLQYHPGNNWILAIGGRNVFRSDVREFKDTMDGIRASEVQEMFYSKLSYRF